MEFRQLGNSGLKVPVLTFGTGTFGGRTDFFKPWGASDVTEATRLVDVCLDAGIDDVRHRRCLFAGAVGRNPRAGDRGRRDRVLVSTKGSFRTGEGPNDVGSSRFHIIEAVDASLKRLGTDYIDLYQLHGFDALTPVGEALGDARRSRPCRQDPLHRRFQLFRLAPDEVAGRTPTARLDPLRRAPGLLLARSAATTSGS